MQSAQTYLWCAGMVAVGALHLRQREWRAPATGAQQARRACSAGLAEGVGQGSGQGSGQVGAGSHAGEAAVQLLIRRVSSGSADGESGWSRKGAAVRRGISPTAALTTAGEVLYTALDVFTVQ